MDEMSRQPVLDLVLDKATRAAFARLTKANLGKPLDLAIDGRVVSSPTVREPIETGRMTIFAQLPMAEAEILAARLRAGGATLTVSSR
jgi:preprotein translocase subunit SecD